MCRIEKNGIPGFDCDLEGQYLASVFALTGDFSLVADSLARQVLTYNAEWGAGKPPDPIIFFHYDKTPDGWSQNGKLLGDLFNPSAVGGNRSDRFLLAQNGMSFGGQVIVMSEDLGEGWEKDYIYVFTDRGDYIEAEAYEHRGSVESLVRTQQILAGKKDQSDVDFTMPIFFKNTVLQSNDIVAAIRQGYQGGQEPTPDEYLSRLQHAADNFDLLKTQYERKVSSLAEQLEREFITSEVGTKFFSDVAHTVVQSMEASPPEEIPSFAPFAEEVGAVLEYYHAEDPLPSTPSHKPYVSHSFVGATTDTGGFVASALWHETAAVGSQLGALLQKNFRSPPEGNGIRRTGDPDGTSQQTPHVPIHVEIPKERVGLKTTISDRFNAFFTSVFNFSKNDTEKKGEVKRKVPEARMDKTQGKQEIREAKKNQSKKTEGKATRVFLKPRVEQLVKIKKEKQAKRRAKVYMEHPTGYRIYTNGEGERQAERRKRERGLEGSINKHTIAEKLTLFGQEKVKSKPLRLKEERRTYKKERKRLRRQRRKAYVEYVRNRKPLERKDRKRRAGKAVSRDRVLQSWEKRVTTGFSQSVEASSDRRTVVRMQFAWMVWWLFHKQKEIGEKDFNKFPTGKILKRSILGRAKILPEMESTTWILLSIIWYLTMIREAGMQSANQQISLLASPVFPIHQQAVIFAFQ